MIRIHRGPEPPLLILARDEHLARARLRGRPPQEIHGYGDARGTLAERQSYKCAYCELITRHEAAPVEHYRPKGKADDIDWSSLSTRANHDRAELEDDERFSRGLPPSLDGFTRIRWIQRPGYWWLAWTWENLVFGCTGCNSGVKNTRFPQTKAAIQLKEHEAPPSGESPLLLDPTDPTIDPIDHIRYLRVHNRWIPTPRDGSPRGAWTIALLRLDSSPALLNKYDRRVRQLEGRARAFEASPYSPEAWDAMRVDLLAPNEELLALTYDWLDARYPEAWRSDHGVRLERPFLQIPGIVSNVVPEPAIAQLDGLEGLPAQLCDRIRIARSYQARGDSPSDENWPMPKIIAEILRHRPRTTDDELGVLLKRKPATIRKHRQ